MSSKRGSVGQSEELLIPRSSVQFRPNPENSDSHGCDLQRPSIKNTKLLSKAITAITITQPKNKPYFPVESPRHISWLSYTSATVVLMANVTDNSYKNLNSPMIPVYLIMMNGFIVSSEMMCNKTTKNALLEFPVSDQSVRSEMSAPGNPTAGGNRTGRSNREKMYSLICVYISFNPAFFLPQRDGDVNS